MSRVPTTSPDVKSTVDDLVQRQAARLRAGPGAAQLDAGHRVARDVAVGGLLAFLVAVPFIGLHIPWLLPGTVDVLSSVGTLQVLGLCFTFAVVALGYDVQFGFTGLLSFGQVVYFATGAYLLDIAMSAWHWALLPALGLTLASGVALSVVLGLLSLRTSGIAFAMVTLALAQATYYLIEDDPHNLTGGDTGLVLDTARLPGWLVGVGNTRYVYWLALAVLVGSYGIVKLCTASAMGRIWLAVRENERRAQVLGLSTLPFKLASVVLSSALATVGGVVYVLLVGTVEPASVASTTVTVSILVMVVLGGAGRRWGAVAGAMVYVYLQQYLLKIAAEPSFASLPGIIRAPLSQPQFLLGALFIVFVLFAPGGIAGLVERAVAGRPAKYKEVAR